MSETTDKELITAVLEGDASSFEPLVTRYQPRVFATARRYARREDEVADIVQEIFIKAYQKLSTYRAEAPFEHWLMRMAVRTCYDFLRKHQRNREYNVTEISDEENDWLENVGDEGLERETDQAAAKALVERLLEGLSPDFRLVITLLEIEEKSVKEIADLTGWSGSLVKVRAYRARNQMRKMLVRIAPEKYL